MIARTYRIQMGQMLRVASPAVAETAAAGGYEKVGSQGFRRLDDCVNGKDRFRKRNPPSKTDSLHGLGHLCDLPGHLLAQTRQRLALGGYKIIK